MNACRRGEVRVIEVSQRARLCEWLDIDVVLQYLCKKYNLIMLFNVETIS